MQEQTGEPQRCVMNLSDGEKLVLMVLADMYKHLEIKGEFDPDFISTTISGGHLWAFRSKYTHIPFEPSENPPEVSETVDILDMWSSLEESYGKLSPADNQKVEKEANRTSVRLFGFDANKEDHYFIARYLIEQLDRYPSFKGRDLNSPRPRIDGYRRMYRVFEAIRPTLVDRTPKHSRALCALHQQFRQPWHAKRHAGHRKAISNQMYWIFIFVPMMARKI